MSPVPYFLSALLLLGATLVVFRAFVRHDYLTRGRLTPFSTVLEWLVFFSWGWFTWADWPRAFPPPELGPLLRTLGFVCIVLGMSGLVAGIAYLGFSRSNGLAVDVLQQSGPYRLSRNPQVVACTVAVIGYALLWPSWHTLGWVALYAAMVHTMILTEEEHLGDVHGEAYARYRARVPRYLGLRRRPLAVGEGGRED
ncbi:MAG: methyltransferase family protein [Planctomycetota bacterium]|jgi:protein-S-isoprenylcysteine O-methyltransferase Ste14